MGIGAAAGAAGTAAAVGAAGAGTAAAATSVATIAAYAGIGASLLGAGVSAYGAIQQGNAKQDAAAYQAQVARNNAIVAGQNAAAARDQAATKAQADQRAGALRLSAQRAAMGASGVTLDSGSALNVQDATVTSTALTCEQDRYLGELNAYGYETQGSNFQAQAGLDQMSADNAGSAGLISAGGTLLSGASQVSSKWASYLNTPAGTRTAGA